LDTDAWLMELGLSMCTGFDRTANGPI